MAEFLVTVDDDTNSEIIPKGVEELEIYQQVQTIVCAAIHFNLFAMRTLRLDPDTYWDRMREFAEEAAGVYNG